MARRKLAPHRRFPFLAPKVNRPDMKVDYSDWLPSLLISETLLLGIALLGCTVVAAGTKVGKRRCAMGGVVAVVLGLLYLYLKMIYVNTGTILCVTQEFVVDQVAPVSIGFAIYAIRRPEGKTCHISSVAIVFSSVLTAVSLSCWLFPESSLVSSAGELRNRLALWYESVEIADKAEVTRTSFRGGFQDDRAPNNLRSQQSTTPMTNTTDGSTNSPLPPPPAR